MQSLRCFPVFGVSALMASQESTPSPRAGTALMLTAVSRDDAMFAGGIGTGKQTVRGTVAVEPLAYLTPSGQWLSLLVMPTHPRTAPSSNSITSAGLTAIR